jgi:two-component system, sensor histidine kinase
VSDPMRPDLENRILVRAPTEKDGILAKDVFERAGIQCCLCSDLEQLCAELDAGAAAVLVAEEVVIQERQECLAAWIAAQPAWSDLPVLVLACPGAESSTVARAMDLLGNVTVIERPTRVSTLVSAVRVALRARQRQYQIREQLVELHRRETMLKTSDRRKNEFLAILAHELRNPLAPISNALHILRLNRTADGTIDQLSAMMERQVQHLVRLVDDLMEVSRISQGKIELRKEPVDVAKIVRSAVETSRPLIEESRHVLETVIPDTPLILEADSVRVAQVLANLLNNAAKYTAPGGHIWLTVRRDADDARISVRDTGVGIPAHMLSHVFDLFTQLEQSASRGQAGLGIGLTLVKNLVEMHGGSVEAFSEGPMKGSEFVVRLPLAPNFNLADAPKKQAPAVSPLSRHRLLVVDDNRDAADSVGLLLRRLGADVQVVYSGEAALLALDAHRPVVVLLDIGMPGMDGHEVARAIRRRTEHDHVVLIALTGWGQREDVLRTRDAGFDHHLIKPLDLNTLEKLLASIGTDSKESRTALARKRGSETSGRESQPDPC